MFTKKRGIQLNEAFGAVLAVVLIAVLVIIAIFLFEILGSTFTATSASVTNESGAYINATGYTVDAASVCNFNTFAVSTIHNASDGVVIAAGNYTVDSSAGTIVNATVTNWADVNVTYTYQWGGQSCDAAEDMVTQFVTYPALVGLVGTIVFLGLVIGVLVTSFVFGGRRKV
jgi:adhesin HecA-like repeat protein